MHFWQGKVYFWQDKCIFGKVRRSMDTITTTGGYVFPVTLENLQVLDPKWASAPRGFTHPVLGTLINTGGWCIERSCGNIDLVTTTYMLMEVVAPHDRDIYHLYYYESTGMFVIYLKVGTKVWVHHRGAPQHWRRKEGYSILKGVPVWG